MTAKNQGISDIVQRTGLTPLQIRHGLAALIQQHLAVWSTGKPSHYEANWPAAYSLVRNGKLIKAARDRFGKRAEVLVSECVRSGDLNTKDLKVFRNPSHNQYNEDDKHDKDDEDDQGDEDGEDDDEAGSHKMNGTNGTSIHSAEDHESRESAFYSLLEQGVIVLSNMSHFRTAAENSARVENLVRAKKFEWKDKIKASDKAEFESLMNKTLDRWAYGSKTVKSAIRTRSLDTVCLKREFQEIEGVKEDDEQKPSKKLKTLNHTNELEPLCDPQLMIRINTDKYPVLARSRRLVKLAADRIGKQTSRVYATVLHLLDQDILECDEFKRFREIRMMDDKQEQPKIETKRILEAMEDFEDLRAAIGNPHKASQESSAKKVSPVLKQSHPNKHLRLSDGEVDRASKIDSDSDSDVVQRRSSKTNGKTKSRGPTTPTTNGKGKGKAKVNINYEDSDTSMDSEDEEEDSKVAMHAVLRQHLLILVDHNLLHHHPPMSFSGGRERWSVPFTSLSHELRLLEINTTIAVHSGSQALRIVRILQEHGILDEKTLIAHALLDTKLIRSTLKDLQSKGYVEMKELPRDNNRAPSKTLYMWSFDADCCRRKLTEDHYQSMSRCFQLLRAEREKVKDLLKKRDRSDVKGHEKDYIVGEEEKRLQQWKTVEAKLLGEISRLDDAVLVLRDL